MARTKFAAKPVQKYRPPGQIAKRPGKSMQGKIQNVVNEAFARHIETKASVQSSTDGQQILHNNFITRTANILSTSQGTSDNATNSSLNRVGDEVHVKGVSIKMMLELNERYSMCTFRVFVVKAAKGDAPTKSTLFTGLSGNKMIDTINNERYTVVASKTCVIRQASTAIDPQGVQTIGSGFAIGTSSVSRATKIIKMWIPGKKFGRNGKVRYESGSTQVKFFDYHLLVYAYTNYDTAETVFNVGRVNDEVIQMFYKDA
jgi:hypothetical protein